MKKADKHPFHFKPVDQAHRSLVHHWLKQPHVSKWFYGQGLQNTLDHLDEFLNGSSNSQYWIGYDQNRPFAFLITSLVNKPHDELTKWCSDQGKAITLDLLIGEADYLGKGLSHLVIQDFLISQFPHVTEVLIDPEVTHAHAIHIYEKVGFKILGEYIPSYNPKPHYMMRLDMKALVRAVRHLLGDNMTISNRLIVISGCSSGGKSTILSELKNRGYTVVPEVGREIVKEQLSKGGEITPWQKPKEFCELLILRSIEAYKTAMKISTAKDRVIFFDRTFLEGIAYYQSLKIQDSHKYDPIVDELRFDPVIFIAPPWKELFVLDQERTHSFEEAVEEYNRLLKFYPKHGYTIVEIPKDTVEKRIEFLLKHTLPIK